MSANCLRRFGLGILLFLAGCGVPEPVPDFQLQPVAFSRLEGWSDDDQARALDAFRRSCERLERYGDDVAMGRRDYAGRIGDWRPACDAAFAVAGTEGARSFFEQYFQPFAVLGDGEAEGQFTGYFEPLVTGARTPGGPFSVPLRRVPDDLVQVDLGLFAEDLSGRKITGRVADGTLEPYFDRASIEQGALDGRGLEVFWLDDPVDKFFLQIQGSGQVRLPDGETVRVGYAGQNGRSYRAIGRDLIEMGELTIETVSLQSIRAWLEAHPDRAAELMNRNPSYVFFHELEGLADAPGPLGSQSVPLEPGRSLAVDRAFLPLGVPVWLETVAPFPDGERPLRRLMIAQDTGGAIKGAVRGDVFWGAGPLAEHVAGHMNSRGRYYILLPRTLAASS